MRKLIGLIVLLGLLSLTPRAFSAEETSSVPEVPVKGMVTMVDLGADKCIPCKMMASVIKSLQEECKGKAAILFIDVWKHPEQEKRFGVRTIPTQIFYDKDGKEFYRHEGYFNSDSIRAVLKKAGVAIAEGAEPSEAGRN